MDLNARIYVAGHRGLVGSAILRRLQAGGYRRIVTRTHEELDLINRAAVERFFAQERPEYVFLAAAKVGGILANSSYPAEFVYQNLAIQTNVIHESWRGGVKRLLFLGSSCIYPRDCPQPIKEDYLLTGQPEPTNRPYAIAKIAGIEMCWSYNRQYGTNFLAVMPTNLYGPGDNFDLRTSHVLPALIHKMHVARIQAAPEVVIWGTGRPRRELLYSDDAADACVHLMRLPDEEWLDLLNPARAPLINVGYGSDLTISELAEMCRRIVGFDGALRFDPSRPDGVPRKLLDVQRVLSLGWRPRVSLEDGVHRSYTHFLTTHWANAAQASA